jgi:hypothetical protein
MRHILKLLALPAACLAFAGCQSAEPTGLNPNPLHVGPAAISTSDQAEFEMFKVCKHGSSADFSFTMDKRANGVGVDSSGTFSLNDGECELVTITGSAGADVTVTETSSESGFHFDHAVLTQISGTTCLDANPVETQTTSTNPEVTGFVSGIASGDGLCHGGLIDYYNVADEHLVNGRMTGGGGQIIIGDVRVSRGLTIHCDIVLSNNLEINWGDNHWHLDKPLTSARCIDDPNVDPAPPPAPFDTFIGEGIGQLNGVDGSLVKFTFVDAGEPGGKNDKAQIQIFDTGGNLVLDVPLSVLDNGNLQAHYDQPHK